MRVSLVTISYNQSRFLRACIESVLSQDYADIEYIVVDPGSTDGSREIIDSYGDKIIKIFSPDSGPADGLNKGFEAATGDIYGFLNSDDTLCPKAISAAVTALREFAYADVVYGKAYIIDQDQGSCARFIRIALAKLGLPTVALFFLSRQSFFERIAFD